MARQGRWLMAFSACISSAALAGTCEDGLPGTNPDGIYAVHANGTVTDKRTHLMWKRCSEGQILGADACTGDAGSYTWEMALEAANAANSSAFAGYSDWYVPNFKELESLVEDCRSDPAINEAVFPGTPGSSFWSSSPVAGHSSYAWVVAFSYGFVGYGGRGYAIHVRLVRGG